MPSSLWSAKVDGTIPNYAELENFPLASKEDAMMVFQNYNKVCEYTSIKYIKYHLSIAFGS